MPCCGCIQHVTLTSCAAFDGPSSTGDLHAEEEQLLKSYPQPAEANKLPRWHDDASAQLVDVDACLHLICTRATAMLSSTGQILCGTLSLLEVLLPLLRLECSAAHASLASGRLKEYMKGLSESLEAHVIIPAAVSDPSEDAITPMEHAINQPLLLKHSGIEVSALIVRCAYHVLLCTLKSAFSKQALVLNRCGVQVPSACASGRVQ